MLIPRAISVKLPVLHGLNGSRISHYNTSTSNNTDVGRVWDGSLEDFSPLQKSSKKFSCGDDRPVGSFTSLPSLCLQGPDYAVIGT